MFSYQGFAMFWRKNQMKIGLVYVFAIGLGTIGSNYSAAPRFFRFYFLQILSVRCTSFFRFYFL